MFTSTAVTALLAFSLITGEGPVEPPNPLEACGLLKEDVPWGVKAYPMYSRLLRKKMCYLVISPHGGIRKGRKYPLIVLLHGLRAKPKTWLKSGFHQLIRRAMRKRKFPHAITVIPAGLDGYWSNWVTRKRRYADLLTKEYLPAVKRRYRRWLDESAGVTLVGMSMGGYGALTLGLKHPKLFKNIVAMRPTDMEVAIEDDPNGRMRVYRRMFGNPPNMALVRDTNPIRLIQSGYGKAQNLFLAYGSSEPRKFSQGTHQLYMAARKQKLNVVLRVVKGGRHSWTSTWNNATQRWWMTRVAPLISTKFKNKR